MYHHLLFILLQIKKKTRVFLCSIPRVMQVIYPQMFCLTFIDPLSGIHENNFLIHTEALGIQIGDVQVL